MDRKDRTGIFISLAAAAILFSILFAGIYFDFWLQLALSILILIFLAFWFSGDDIKKQLNLPAGDLGFSILLGLVSTVFLYLIFLIGNDLAIFFLSFGKSGISGIYGLGENVDSRMIAFLLVLIIGPGEEIFWRGYLQKSLTKEYGKLGVVIIILAYAGVHLASGNTMLILAAFAGGVFWGLLYYYYRNLWANIISHAAWDLAAFVLWPF
ncbi:MAG: CPBP family intramembrane metalloprotease [Thermoplasmata archaeon]|nr:CPBP family intramembrane metalloprotease [Thermoplasmata archaeon]